MMEGLGNAYSTIIVVVFSLLLLVKSNIAQQAGFISIKCCADAPFIDENTSISYIPDESWYPDKHSCQDKVGAGHADSSSNNNVRFFSSEYDSKWCYRLPTRSNDVYQIRGVFAPPESFFNVSVGTTEIARVNSDNKNPHVEVIFRAYKSHTDFCLVKGKGAATLSKVEIRPSNEDYLRGDVSRVLEVVDRVDVGNKEVDIRYPSDPYDRIWRSDLYPNSTAAYISSSASTTNITIANTILPPPQVLQTGLSDEQRLEFYYDNLDEGVHYYNLYLHFVELNTSVRKGQRVFDVYINNKQQLEVDVLASDSHYFGALFNFTANGVLNLTLARGLNSTLGPICNAYEILQVIPGNKETNEDDVNAITKVKDELVIQNRDNEVLKTWSGDPCLPLPWQGLSCEPINNGIPAIVKMDLSLSKLEGPLPSSITNLIYLQELNVSNNGLVGKIPEFPASSMLMSLDLSHNDLTGNLTQFVFEIPHLKVLFFGCNPRLNTSLPQNPNNPNMITDNGKCNSLVYSHRARAIFIGTISSALLLVAIVLGLCFLWFYIRKFKVRQKFDIKGHTMSKNAIYSVSIIEDVIMKPILIQRFTLISIESATQNYKTLIGEGGFGPVYRGTLSDGEEVAVKVRSANSTQGTREFDNELNMLSAIQHENLVPLIGYCCDNDQQILVYPFMSNGSLQDRLYGAAAKRKILDWPTRLSIALGAARGLTYLHTFSERCLVHRDVKSSNILLDHSMCAKVADFGFSKYASQEGDSGTSLEVRGTAGYLDPEYYSTQHLSAKSDVFSFGVVLLEIVSGREPLNISRPRNEWSLVEWAKPFIKNSRVEEIVDPNIKGSYHGEAMWRVVEVALACIEPYSAYRPSMSDIVRELEDAFIIENNASEYMRSIESFGGSNRYSIERPSIGGIVSSSTTIALEPSPILLQPPPPQPR